MLTIILLGVFTSFLSEAITWINAKLDNTILKGDAAFLIALAMAIVGATVKELMTPGFSFATLHNWSALTQTATEVWAVSQLYFYFIVKKLNLDVTHTPVDAGPASV